MVLLIVRWIALHGGVVSGGPIRCAGTRAAVLLVLVLVKHEHPFKHVIHQAFYRGIHGCRPSGPEGHRGVHPRWIREAALPPFGNVGQLARREVGDAPEIADSRGIDRSQHITAYTDRIKALQP